MAENIPQKIDRRAHELYEKGLAALERNNLDYAIEMFSGSLVIAPNFLQGRKYLRAAQLKRADSASSFKKMMTSAKVAPTITKAKLAITKNPLEAMQIAESALNEDPKSGQALLTLAEAAEAAKMPEVAAQSLETFLKLYPNDKKAPHWLARMYSAMGKHVLARETYERILQANPNDFEAQKGLKDSTAHGAMQGGGWDEAKSYRDVMKDKDEAVKLEQESRVVRAEDHVDNLIKELLAKAKLEPDNPLHERELGRLYASKGDLETGLRYLEKNFAGASGNDPGLEKEINDIKAKQIQVRVNEKKTALTAKPGDPAIEAEIAALEMEHSKLQLRDAERLVERYPNDLMYRFDLGVLYVKTGNTEGAIGQFQKSVGQPQRRVPSLNYLGHCFQKLGMTDLAIDQYLKALEELPIMDGLKKEVTYNLAVAYEEVGEIEKAVAELKKILAVDFDYRDVRTRVVALQAKRKSAQG